MKVDTHTIRRENLRKIIDDNFRSDYQSVASLLKKAEGTIRKYLAKNSGRPISTAIARDFERKLHLPTGYLDTENHGEQNVYYVTLSVHDSETHDIIEWLYENAPEVTDCSAILGKYDIIMKIEVPNFHYLEGFFSRLARLPKTLRTQTFASIDSLRWQRDQTAHYSVKNPKKASNFVEYYKESRLNELTKDIQDIERGKIVASNRMSQRISLLEIMQWTKKSFLSVREYNEEIDQYDEYLEEEGQRIRQGVKSKRIFLLPKRISTDPASKLELKNLLEKAQAIVNLGGEVKFVNYEKWISRMNDLTPECFAVVDSEFVYVRKSGSNKSVLHEGREYIDVYQRVFDRNWEIGIPIEKLTAH